MYACLLPLSSHTITTASGISDGLCRLVPFPAAGKFTREYVDATVPEMAFGEVPPPPLHLSLLHPPHDLSFTSPVNTTSDKADIPTIALWLGSLQYMYRTV